MKSDLIELDEKEIKNKIYEIRGILIWQNYMDVKTELKI